MIALVETIDGNHDRQQQHSSGRPTERRLAEHEPSPPARPVSGSHIGLHGRLTPAPHLLCRSFTDAQQAGEFGALFVVLLRLCRLTDHHHLFAAFGALNEMLTNAIVLSGGTPAA